MKCKCDKCTKMWKYIKAYRTDRNATPPSQDCADALIAHSDAPKLEAVTDVKRD